MLWQVMASEVKLSPGLEVEIASSPGSSQGPARGLPGDFGVARVNMEQIVDEIYEKP
jgi:hypothetical protein